VISGFLISTIIFENLQNNNFRFHEFYSRRIKRIFPALIFVLLASFIVGWFTLLADDYSSLGKHIAAGSIFISNFILWNESGYFDAASNTKPLLHLWSLGIEEQFYILWPLLLWASWKKKVNWLIVIAAIIVVSFTLNIRSTHSNIVKAFYSPGTRFWELLIGSLSAYILLHKDKIVHVIKKWKYCSDLLESERNVGILRNGLSVIGFAFIITSLFFISNSKNFPGAWALLPTLGAAFIILAGSQAWLNRSVLSNNIFIWFGLISFPLYLWHWPLLSFTQIMESHTPSRIIRVMLVIMSIGLAWLTYRYIEKPIRHGKFHHIYSIILIILMAIVGSIGYYSFIKGGFKLRFPIMIRELTQFSYDIKESYKQTTCFLDPDQDYKQFQDCGVTRDKTKKTMFIWGDSHAAHLFEGYKVFFENKFNLIHRAASACPPILGEYFPDRKYCKEINDKTFELLKRVKPDKVVLSAIWWVYDWKKISRTIAELKKIGVSDITIVGPVPNWTDTLPRLLYQRFKQDPLHRIPTRMVFGLNEEIPKNDLEMEKLAHDNHVNYISTMKILCSSKGCLTRLGNTGSSLVAWDASHLTSQGSIYLVSKFPQ
jgi:peptidoglycan/LPS O-acetylase OafA/YrhL